MRHIFVRCVLLNVNHKINHLHRRIKGSHFIKWLPLKWSILYAVYLFTSAAI